ncbi:MAG: hypothetical protein AAGL49_09595 [Pseudomonadota bacterium]
MPQHGRSEGVWEGVYIYTDPEGRELDRHASRLTHVFPDDAPTFYRQHNHYEWADGRTEDFHFEFEIDPDRPVLSWRNERSQGLVWEEPLQIGDLASVRVSWHRTVIEGYSPFDVPSSMIHELIQMDKDFRHRGRVWQWFMDGELIGRTQIKERRVA